MLLHIRSWKKKKAYIRKIVEEEEKTFAKTVDKGFDMLSGILTQLKGRGQGVPFPGEDAFKLSDTYGFPIDLTEEIAAEQSVSVDRERFCCTGRRTAEPCKRGLP